MYTQALLHLRILILTVQSCYRVKPFHPRALLFFSTRWNWSLRVAHMYIYMYTYISTRLDVPYIYVPSYFFFLPSYKIFPDFYRIPFAKKWFAVSFPHQITIRSLPFPLTDKSSINLENFPEIFLTEPSPFNIHNYLDKFSDPPEMIL